MLFGEDSQAPFDKEYEACYSRLTSLACGYESLAVSRALSRMLAESVDMVRVERGMPEEIIWKLVLLTLHRSGKNGFRDALIDFLEETHR